MVAALAKLEGLADSTDFLLGHNLIDFDLPHLQAVNPRLRLLQLPAVDTLRRNPLAFPRNPYHHLVKHYQDRGLNPCISFPPTHWSTGGEPVRLRQQTSCSELT